MTVERIESPLSAAAVAERTIDWPAVLAGAVVTTAIALVLLGFGAAIGLSVTSPFEGEGLDARAVVIAAGLWFLWVQLCSFWCGAYVAVRVARRSPLANEHESDVRDGLHGLLVWATGVIIAASISLASVGGVVGAPNNSPIERIAERTTDVVSERAEEDLATPAADRPSAMTATEENAVDAARKAGVIGAFITAASILVGAAAAFIAAGMAGRHRDNSVVMRLFTRH